MSKIRIVLADDHTLVRGGIRALLESIPNVEVIAESGDGREALELIAEHEPEVALLDIGMPSMNGLEVARQASKDHPRTKVVILSMHADAAYVKQALQAGVAGYLLKGAAVAELPLALQSVARGEVYLTPKVSQSVVQGFLREGPESEEGSGSSEGLTRRQREILQLIAEGKSTKEIAHVLDVSVKTVETHRMRLMDRLGIHDVPGLVRYAIRSGIVSPDT
jgi:DNA-binding NarL/FixJ family response regulator